MTPKPDLHPACAQWPKMPGTELKELAEDIKQKGLLEDIVLTADGKLLDGNSRWDACELAGVEPRTIVYQGNDPIGFVISKNKYRKHLEANQLVIVTARLAKLKPGQQEASVGDTSLKNLAKQAGISPAAVKNARTVLNHGAPNVVAMVEKGEVSLRTAREAVCNAPKETQATWTKEDVQREGRKAMDSYPSSQERKAATKKRAPKEPKKQFAPWPTMKFPTAEETGFPINGTIAEKDAHHKKYGRTPMHPKEVKEMLNNEAWVNGYVGAIIYVTNDAHPEAEACLKALDEMLAWVPKPEKGQDWGINFAAKAKKHLALITEQLPAAIDRLTKLSNALKQRSP